MLFIYLLAEGEEFFWVFIYLPFFFGGFFLHFLDTVHEFITHKILTKFPVD